MMQRAAFPMAPGMSPEAKKQARDWVRRNAERRPPALDRKSAKVRRAENEGYTVEGEHFPAHWIVEWEGTTFRLTDEGLAKLGFSPPSDARNVTPKDEADAIRWLRRHAGDSRPFPDGVTPWVVPDGSAFATNGQLAALVPALRPSGPDAPEAVDPDLLWNPPNPDRVKTVREALVRDHRMLDDLESPHTITVDVAAFRRTIRNLPREIEVVVLEWGVDGLALVVADGPNTTRVIAAEGSFPPARIGVRRDYLIATLTGLKGEVTIQTSGPTDPIRFHERSRGWRSIVMPWRLDSVSRVAA